MQLFFLRTRLNSSFSNPVMAHLRHLWLKADTPGHQIINLTFQILQYRIQGIKTSVFSQFASFTSKPLNWIVITLIQKSFNQKPIENGQFFSFVSSLSDCNQYYRSSPHEQQYRYKFNYNPGQTRTYESNLWYDHICMVYWILIILWTLSFGTLYQKYL